MAQFIEIAASKSSINNRSNILGVGINDAEYHITNCDKDGRILSRCPYYSKWSGMLRRCYCEVYQKKQVTYKGCVVCDEWLIFSSFKLWMKGQSNWEGNEIDKDILVSGNKVYSPKTCRFVSHRVNNLFNIHLNIKRSLPTGICWDKDNGKFLAQISMYGKTKKIGRFDILADATNAYRRCKKSYIIELAENECDDIKQAMLIRADMIVLL